MADLTRGGKAADSRQAVIRLRRIQHEMNAIRVSVEKFEIDILEAEMGIERTREAIVANTARIEKKEEELAQLRAAHKGEEVDGPGQ